MFLHKNNNNNNNNNNMVVMLMVIIVIVIQLLSTVFGEACYRNCNRSSQKWVFEKLEVSKLDYLMRNVPKKNRKPTADLKPQKTVLCDIKTSATLVEGKYFCASAVSLLMKDCQKDFK